VAIPLIMQSRESFKPFKYPEAYNFYLKQKKMHWIHTEIDVVGDLHNIGEFTKAQQHAFRNSLKLFTTFEIWVGNYWIDVVYKYFKQYEIRQLATAIADIEWVHGLSYDLVNDAFGLSTEEFYLSYLDDPQMTKRIQMLKDQINITNKNNSVRDILISLAVFSAFTEGVSLYSQFALLVRYAKFGKLIKIKSIITASNRDEALHSSAGIWLFKTLLKESEYTIEDIQDEILESAKAICELEYANVDEMFRYGQPLDFTDNDMKNFIFNRTIGRVKMLGIDNNKFGQEKEESISSWFYDTVGIPRSDDFFTRTIFDYEPLNTEAIKGW
jgi:ribonucleoside-diphosphate reductase beta chain